MFARFRYIEFLFYTFIHYTVLGRIKPFVILYRGLHYKEVGEIDVLSCLYLGDRLCNPEPIFLVLAHMKQMNHLGTSYSFGQRDQGYQSRNHLKAKDKKHIHD